MLSEIYAVLRDTVGKQECKLKAVPADLRQIRRGDTKGSEKMYKKKPVFLTDGKGGIYKIEKLIKGAILKNLETGEQLTVEHPLPGFAVIDMPKVNAASSGKPEASDTNKPRENMSGKDTPRKTRKGKSSQYWGVGLNKKTGKWKTAMYLDGKNISVGNAFVNEIDAAKAVDAELEKRGLPKRNFP